MECNRPGNFTLLHHPAGPQSSFSLMLSYTPTPAVCLWLQFKAPEKPEMNAVSALLPKSEEKGAFKKNCVCVCVCVCTMRVMLKERLFR